MARRAVIDRDELFETADRLAADGKEVTALALLTALGGGSLTTIYKYLSEWDAGRPKAAPVAGASEIPDPVQNSFANTWRIAVSEAARETAAIKEKAAEDVKAARKQFEGALEAIQKLESESERDAAQVEALTARVTESEAIAVSVGNDNAALKATVEQLQQRVQLQQADIDRLHKEREAERKQYLDELNRAKSELAEAHKKATTQIERLTADREAAIKDAAQLKGETESLKAMNAHLLDKLAERPSQKKS